MASVKSRYTINYDFKQFKEYNDKLKNLQGDFDKFLENFLNYLANEIIRQAVPRTPVDTGRLRRSYKVTKVEFKGDYTEITVYNDARDNGAGESYASFVELGHYTRNRVSFVKGVGMLRIATDYVRSRIQSAWNSEFDKWVRSNGL